MRSFCQPTAIGNVLSGGVTSLLGQTLGDTCPANPSCDPGSIRCNAGPCRDSLSDPTTVAHLPRSECLLNGVLVTVDAYRYLECAATGSVRPRPAMAPPAEASKAAAVVASVSRIPLVKASVALTPHVLLCRVVPREPIAQNQVCATNTCCAKNVCFGACSAVSLPWAGNFGR